MWVHTLLASPAPRDVNSLFPPSAAVAMNTFISLAPPALPVRTPQEFWLPMFASSHLLTRPCWMASAVGRIQKATVNVDPTSLLGTFPASAQLAPSNWRLRGLGKLRGAVAA